MKPASLLAELRQRGIEVSLRGADIAYRGPKGAMTENLLAEFRAQKEEIIAELQTQSATDDTGFEFLTALVELELAAGEQPTHDFARFVEPLKSLLLARVGLDIEFTQGDGCWLVDEHGNRYLDCIAQYGGLPFGYNPAEIWQAVDSVRENQIPNVATQTLLGPAGKLANNILQLLPKVFEHVVFCNSGAEATEVAIKMVRAAKDRPGILSTKQAFHGLTTGALSTSGSESFQDGFYVRCPDFQHVPFGDARALEQKLKANPQRFAAFIVEPIQGEAGIVVPPPGYLRQVRELCSQHDVLMVLDEVQAGLGRTGRMFAFEHSEIVPDVITLAKALGGGLMPIGAVIAQPVAYSTRFGLRHSSTFAGNAIASHCGIATIEKLQENDRQILRSVQANGELMLNGLKAIQDRFPHLVRDTRGQGYMLAIEFDFDGVRNRKGLLPILVEQKLLLHLMISYLLRRHGIRVAPTFMGRNVIRLEPPLIFERQDCERLLNALEDALDAVDSGRTAELIAIMIGVDPNQILARSAASTSDQPAGIASENIAIREQAKERSLSNERKLVGEFGFLVHLSGLDDLVQFDPALAVLTDSELADLKHEFTRSAEPAVLGVSEFCSATGSKVRGHFVLVPFTPQELLAMPGELAIEHVAHAADAVSKVNIGLIGLGGFTSIVTGGGLALDAKNLPPITSGNAYTVAASIESIESASRLQGIELSSATVAIVGASGQIGRAAAIMLGEKAAKVVLVGRDGTEERTRKGLQNIADEIAVRRQHEPAQISLALTIEEISAADIVVVASSAPEAIIKSEYIKPNAIVCDASRPANVSESVKETRSDVVWIEGGLISIPGCNDLSLFAGPRPDAAYACVAETALWALEPSLGRPSAVQLLDVELVRRFGGVAKRHGFEVLK